jgi:serine/threonine-protein kinase
MGSVYEATDLVLGRKVAVKMIERFSALNDPLVRARFDREIALATRLDHPGLVRTFDVIAREDGGIGVVMELVEGPMLGQAPPPDAAHVVRWGIELCHTLQYLADLNVARIDLKPSNIILRDGEHPVIVDLGIAKALDDRAFTITAVNELVGTPTYMAPEQINSTLGSVDIRADLYSLGVVLFELLGGAALRPPLDGLYESIIRTLEQDVPVDELPVSAELRHALHGAVARDPADRYARPDEMARDLRAAPEAAADEAVTGG